MKETHKAQNAQSTCACRPPHLEVPRSLLRRRLGPLRARPDETNCAASSGLVPSLLYAPQASAFRAKPNGAGGLNPRGVRGSAAAAQFSPHRRRHHHRGHAWCLGHRAGLSRLGRRGPRRWDDLAVRRRLGGRLPLGLRRQVLLLLRRRKGRGRVGRAATRSRGHGAASLARVGTLRRSLAQLERSSW